MQETNRLKEFIRRLSSTVNVTLLDDRTIRIEHPVANVVIEIKDREKAEKYLSLLMALLKFIK